MIANGFQWWPGNDQTFIMATDNYEMIGSQRGCEHEI
jgi:hypothetical protein